MAELEPASRFEWERIVRRCRIPGATKLVGYTMAQYGDVHGCRIRPGTERLAATCVMSTRTVERHIAALLGYGLVERLANGGGRNRAAALYRLTIPEDLLERVDLLGPDETTPATQKAGVEPVDNQGSTPVDNTELPPPMAGVDGSPDTELPPLVTELPPLDDRTPATAVADHQGDQPLIKENPPLVSTSPVDTPAERESMSTPPPRAAARPDGHRQLAVWPAPAPDPPPDSDAVTRAGPGTLRARIAAARTQPHDHLRGAS